MRPSDSLWAGYCLFDGRMPTSEIAKQMKSERKKKPKCTKYEMCTRAKHEDYERCSGDSSWPWSSGWAQEMGGIFMHFTRRQQKTDLDCRIFNSFRTFVLWFVRHCGHCSVIEHAKHISVHMWRLFDVCQRIFHIKHFNAILKPKKVFISFEDNVWSDRAWPDDEHPTSSSDGQKLESVA